MDIDEKIRELFSKLGARKAKVEELKKQIAKSWKTNGTLRVPGTSSTINIQTASAETVEECATYICMVSDAKRIAAAALSRPVDPKIQNYSFDDWFNDFSKRLAAIDVREEEKQIEALEARLNQVLSPDERR